MWYTTILNDEPAVMYKTDEQCVIFALSASPLYWKDRYEEWVAEGNEAQPWGVPNGN